MKASSNNSITKVTQLTLALFVFLLSGTASAEPTETETRVQHATESTSAVHRHTSTHVSTVSHIVFNNDQGMPLAREDVNPIRTAVVPGQSFVPSTAPRYTPPTHQPSHQPATPQYRTPQYQTPQYQTPQYQVPGTIPRIPTDVKFDDSNRPDKSQLKISSRFTNPKMLGFLRSTSMQELVTLYQEASRMIDSRHVNPPSYEARMRSSVSNVIKALENDNFLRANNVAPNANVIRQVQSQLTQVSNSQPSRTANEAVGIMQWSAELVSRELGVRREAVALEFLNGTIDSLDKYSAFMPEVAGYSPGAELESRKTASLEENIVGIGVEMETHPMGAILVGVVDNSPASGLGLQAKDLIVAVNGQSVRGLNLNEVASKLGGPEGATISLDIERAGQRYRGSLTRRRMYVSSVTGTKMVDQNNKIGYVRLKQFSQSSRKDLEAAMWKLYNQGMRSLVLDLRGNPGGLLDQAIDVSNLFLPCGTIVSTKGRNTSDNTSENATKTKTWSVALVVLVDENSASASEIFAAAIQENQRGVVVGRKSYGKGTVQTHFPLRTTSGLLKLTTAKFYSPNGREMAGAGVTPDVLINEREETGYRGSDYDADIEAALSVFQQGTPSRLAQQAANCQRPDHQAHNTNSNNWSQQLQRNIFGR